jgi:hypothetical protein
MTAEKPSAFAAPTRAPSVGSKPHPFTPQLARQMAATPPILAKDAKTTPFGTRLPPELQRMFKTACAERGIRMQDAVYEALWQWLNTRHID